MKKTGQIANFQFQISLTIGILVTIASIVAVISYIYPEVDNNKRQEKKNNVSFIVTTVGIAAGVTSAFYAADTISRNSQNNKTNKAINLISEWNNMDLQIYKDVLGELRANTEKLKEEQKGVVINGIIQNNPGYQGKIIGYLNFLEYISLLVLSGHADEYIIREYFCVIFHKADDLLGLWIKQRQKNSNNVKIYENFIKLNNQWNNPNLNQ